jgi:glycyl-tRNA synthetase beta chain
MTSELILEIGVEEIPSGYLDRALDDLRQLARDSLDDNRIEVSHPLESYGTPRRLVLIGRGLALKQQDFAREFKGPPKKVAYDKDGKPTRAAEGFAKKYGISVDEIGFVETPKGEYLHVKRLIPGQASFDLLKELLPDLIADIPWPKSMRWGETDFSFVRPIHWILCLLDGQVVPFEVAGIKSGNLTRGHRFMAPESREISNVSDYFQAMEKGLVMVDPATRRQAVKRAVEKAAQKAGGKPATDPVLSATVTNLVEYPSAVCGEFDMEFLDLPEDVLITAMREHQKYFAVYDENGQLMPRFVAVNNTATKDEDIVRKGHERVLRARLSDANFFFKEDQTRPLKARLEDLKNVIYQADLGSSYAKVDRFKRLSEHICRALAFSKPDEAMLAAELCKCDLVTHMVAEFPSLQGRMGREYANREGYPDEVCVAIYEHYLPLAAGGRLPSSAAGAIVGIADRLDTITGCFATGLIPSGSADPFALRRHALAIIRILEKMNWDLSLEEIIQESISILGKEIDFDTQSVFTNIMDFFKERYRQMMFRAGYESDIIEAVISVAFDRINQSGLRIDQLKKFASESDGFNELALTFKRVSNILKNQKETFGKVEPSLFQDQCESDLWNTYQEVKDDVRASLKNRDYYGALSLMARLKEPVDAFFDGVEILTKDNQGLRKNRVGLLRQLEQLLMSVADFSRFSI